jgi:hypothetical protein
MQDINTAESLPARVRYKPGSEIAMNVFIPVHDLITAESLPARVRYEPGSKFDEINVVTVESLPARFRYGPGSHVDNNVDTAESLPAQV